MQDLRRVNQEPANHGDQFFYKFIHGQIQPYNSVQYVEESNGEDNRCGHQQENLHAERVIHHFHDLDYL